MAYLMLNVPQNRMRRDEAADGTEQSELDASLANRLATRTGQVGGTLLLANESAANDALTRYRLAALKALGDFTALRGKDAVDSHDSYRQALQDGRDGVFADAPDAAKALLQPHLDRLHNEHLQWGMAHRAEQDKQWANRSAIDALEADKKEAVLRPDDLNLLQRLAERSDQAWNWIGQREGWPDEVVMQHAQQAKSELFGQVMATQMDKGDSAGAERTWQFAQNHVAPQILSDATRNVEFRQVRSENNGAPLETVQSDRQLFAQSVPRDNNRTDVPTLPGASPEPPTPSPIPQRNEPSDTQPLTSQPNLYVVPRERHFRITSRVPDEKDSHAKPETIGRIPVDIDEMYRLLDFDPEGIDIFQRGLLTPGAATVILHGYITKEEVVSWAREKGLPDLSEQDGVVDALRHALWNFRMTRALGADTAKKYADALEITRPNPPGGRLIDLYNNRIGRLLYRNPMGLGKTDIEVVWEAYKAGLLRTSPFAIAEP